MHMHAGRLPVDAVYSCAYTEYLEIGGGIYYISDAYYWKLNDIITKEQLSVWWVEPGIEQYGYISSLVGEIKGKEANRRCASFRNDCKRTQRRPARNVRGSCE